MNYASYVNRVKSFIIDSAKQADIDESLNNPWSDFKETAYYLFDELITITAPFDYQEPHPIAALFKLTKQSLHQDNQSEHAILACLESWWREWHFVATMNAKLLEQHNDPQQDYLIAHTHHPMRNHELSHYAKLFTVLPMPICNVCIETGDILKVNQRYIDVFGYTINETPNVADWWIKAYPDAAQRAAAQELWRQSLITAQNNNGDIPAHDYQITCKNGAQVMMQVSGISIGKEFLVVFNDATERVKAHELLSEMAFLDSLTKIANRRRFDEKIASEFAKVSTTQSPLSLILIDIDNFKQFNDRYGHIAGDECLYNVAQKLAETVSRPEDFVARYGGEEFVVLLPQTNEEGALFVAEQIQKAIEKLAIEHIDSFTGYLSISMGINTITPEQCDDYMAFVHAADNALYYAKKQGRNCIALSAE
ncbi:diguanylate cyclase [Pseudoalteromonas sp.]|uniref:sensor domain-containing diguanylate cyclase n=1 Tax=Pseudoalteromonas sp. TaxID=53249 RepID=UPI00356A90FB